MTHHHKIALVLGFALCLLVAVVISDHFSAARSAQLDHSIGAPAGVAGEPTASVDAGSADWATGWGRRTTSTPVAPLAPLPDPDAPVRRADADPEPTPEPVVIANGPAAELMNPETERGAGGLAGLLRGESSSIAALMASETSAVRPAGPSGRGAEVLRRQQPTERSDVNTGTPSGSPTAPVRPSTRTYVVRSGDTLFGLAERTLGDGNRWRELQQLNADRVRADGALRVGLRIKLPVAGDAGREQPAPTRQRTTPQRTDTGVRYYVVKSGDTLGTIAQRELGTVRRVPDLIRVNNAQIRDEDEIFVGMKLQLPG